MTFVPKRINELPPADSADLASDYEIEIDAVTTTGYRSRKIKKSQLPTGGGGVASVTGTAVDTTDAANPVINVATPKQYTITPASGELDYDLGLASADFQLRQAFAATIGSNTELQLPTFNSGALPTDFATSFMIEVTFSANVDLTFVAGYQNEDAALPTISGVTGEVYRLYATISEASGIIDVNPIQIV